MRGDVFCSARILYLQRGLSNNAVSVSLLAIDSNILRIRLQASSGSNPSLAKPRYVATHSAYSLTGTPNSLASHLRRSHIHSLATSFSSFSLVLLLSIAGRLPHHNAKVTKHRVWLDRFLSSFTYAVSGSLKSEFSEFCWAHVNVSQDSPKGPCSKILIPMNWDNCSECVFTHHVMTSLYAKNYKTLGFKEPYHLNLGWAWKLTPHHQSLGYQDSNRAF